MKRRNMTAMAMAAMMIMANVSPSVVAFADSTENNQQNEDTSSGGMQGDGTQGDGTQGGGTQDGGTEEGDTQGDGTEEGGTQDGGSQTGDTEGTGQEGENPEDTAKDSESNVVVSDGETHIYNKINGWACVGEGTTVNANKITGVVEAWNNSTVTSKGDIGGGVYANNSTVKAGGTVGNREGSYYPSTLAGIMAYSNSTVEVGSVTSDVKASNSTVTSKGDIGGWVRAEGSTVKADGDVGSAVIKGSWHYANETIDASNSTVEVGGSVTGSVNAYDDSKVTSKKGISGDVFSNRSTVSVTDGSITGNVTAHYGATVTSKGEIGGDVSAEAGSMVTAESITGDVNAEIRSAVTSEGDISGKITADNSEVIVGGDVGSHAVEEVAGDEETPADKEAVDDAETLVPEEAADNNVETVDETYTIDAKNEARVTVGGDVISANGNAIKISGEKVSVLVEGDVTTDAETLTIHAGEAAGGELAVGGTVQNSEKETTLIVRGKDGELDENAQLPEIVVGSIEDIENLNVQTADGKELDEEAKAEVISNIKYIISREDLENGTLTITKLNDGAEDGALDQDASGTYDVAKANETFKVNIVTVSGYKVSKFNSGKAAFTQNEDGSYTVTVPAGGGVNLSAVLELIEKAEEKTEPKEETKEESTESKAEDTAAKEENTATTTVSKSHGGGSGSVKGSSHAVAVTAGAGRTTLQNTPGSWQKNADNSWSYLDANGAVCRSGWIVSNGRWYYADANGRIATGWMEINDVWYYFSMTESGENPEGAMLAGVTTPDGYKLDSNGAWLK